MGKTTSIRLYKICPVTARTLRLAALTPLLAFGGSKVDAMALRGRFQPVISSYHAICAQNRRDSRCARLTEFEVEPAVAKIEKAPVSRGSAKTL